MKTKIKLAVAEDSDYNLNLLKLTLSRFSNVVVNDRMSFDRTGLGDKKCIWSTHFKASDESGFV